MGKKKQPSDANTPHVDRREFGRLMAGVGAGALLSSHAAISSVVGTHALASISFSRSSLSLKSGQAIFNIDALGAFTAISINGKNCIAPDNPAPLLTLRVDGNLCTPSGLNWNAAGKSLTLAYESIGAKAVVAVQAKATHVTFELVELHSAKHVELVLWGPYPINIGDLVGEVVGVVRNADLAIGIQALNTKTLGGHPTQDSDIKDNVGTFDDKGTYPGLPEELKKNQGWRGDTAKPQPYGSSLQAYCRNRDQQRVIQNWGIDKFPVPAFEDGGVIGSKIALFAVPATQALPTIGEIEVAEGLPHPMLDGKWAKLAPGATASYLIVDFGEATIDRAIEMTQRAGLKYLYQSSPFAAWGHFKLKPALFPNGWDGFRDCVDKARKAGIGIGFHTLSNFITPNDPYVTPKPDKRLARSGTSQLTADLDAQETEILVASPDAFQKKTDMSTVTIGEELIQYDGVSSTSPWRLLNCKRGAWGTKPAAHNAGAEVGKLVDHPYKVFLTDEPLAQEVARNIADFCNHTGAMQLSFDGLEGNWSTGLGQYGCSMFTKTWYDALSPNLRGRIINDASNPHHYAWHIATRYNWGEPWYAGFRQSQTVYRLKNQLFFTRNLMPHMLGWFSLRKGITLADAEWLCARAAGFDAGFALATSFDSQANQTSGAVAAIDENKAAILDVVRQWETARQSGAFPENIKPKLQDVNLEFHLTAAGPGQWDLYQINSASPALRIKSQRRNSI